MTKGRILMFVRLIVVLALLTGGVWALGKYVVSPEKAEATLMCDPPCSEGFFCSMMGNCEPYGGGGGGSGEYCGPGAPCADGYTCYCDPMDICTCQYSGGGGGGGGGEWGYCGDGYCSGMEDSTTCPGDCTTGGSQPLGCEGCAPNGTGGTVGDCPSICEGAQCYFGGLWGGSLIIPCNYVACHEDPWTQQMVCGCEPMCPSEECVPDPSNPGSYFCDSWNPSYCTLHPENPMCQ